MKISIYLLMIVTPLDAGGCNMDHIPDLSTAKLNIICGEIANGKTSRNDFNQGLCIGIILGVEDNAHYDRKICIPKNIDIKKRAQVIKDFVATQPNRMNESFASLAFDALVQKWPCTPK
jgi:hypothetical protein